MGLARRIAAAMIGAPCALPPGLVRDHPELGRLRLRRGGIPPRLGGWCLGRATVGAITLGGTVWLGARQPVSADLLLHEFCHVTQFQADPLFPLRYVWESLRRGYGANRFEIAAREYARAALRGPRPGSLSEDV